MWLIIRTVSSIKHSHGKKKNLSGQRREKEAAYGAGLHQGPLSALGHDGVTGGMEESVAHHQPSTTNVCFLACTRLSTPFCFLYSNNPRQLPLFADTSVLISPRYLVASHPRQHQCRRPTMSGSIVREINTASNSMSHLVLLSESLGPVIAALAGIPAATLYSRWTLFLLHLGYLLGLS